MTTQVSHENLTPALLALHRAVPGSRIETTEPVTPICTIGDGKRQVISMPDIPDLYDLWVPRRKPKRHSFLGNEIIDDVTAWKLGASFNQAVAFLNGATKAEVMAMEDAA